VNIFAPVRDYVQSLVHASARRDLLTAARHRAFIAPRLAGGLVALALFPVQLATRGFPTPLETVVFGWMILPTLVVYYVSRTGQLDEAYLLGSLTLTALVTGIAALTGGLASIATIWLLLVPLEAALSGSRRPVLGACCFVISAGALIIAAGALGFGAWSLGWQDFSAVPAVGATLVYAMVLAVIASTPAQVGEELLRAQEARFRLLADHMTEVILTHAGDGAVDFVTPASERVIGVAAGALRGHQLFDRIHVADRPAYLKVLSDAAIGAASQAVELRILQHPTQLAGALHPRFLWLELRSYPLDGAQGATRLRTGRAVVSVLRDITERKNQEQALETARRQAEQARVATSRFLTTMSHELRTPLNAIIGFSDMLGNEQALNLEAPRRHDYAQLINECGQHLLSVVNGILDMSQLGTGNFQISPEPFALAPVIAGCCELLALTARESGIELVFRPPPPFADIIADKRAIKQVLLNLVSNAVKFTRRDGQVTVSATQEQSLVTIVVEDTGVGIPEADIKRLGDPFFQVRGSCERPREGTGLGLSIVKGLIKLHGGTLEINSRLGQGTRVLVRLPINRAAAAPSAARGSGDRGRWLESVTQITDARMKKRA
jgi:two-component system, cell cycle sensor histidine kinase DivJ